MQSSILAELRTAIPNEIVDGLSATYAFWKWLPFFYVFIGHSLFCSMSAKDLRDRCFVHYVLTFLWGNGGGVVTAALIMAPQHAKFSFFASNEVLGIWTVCWWIVNYFPGGKPYELLSIPYIKVWVRSCTALLRAMLIVSRVDLAVKLYPGVVAAPIVLGTLAGCGGRLIADALLYNWNRLAGYAELSSPGFVSRSAAMAAVTYYVLGYVLQLLPATAAAGLVVTTLMLHAFAAELSGRELDFTAPVARALHKLTLTPLPPAQPRPVPTTVYKKSNVATPAPAVPAAACASPKAKTPAKSLATTPVKAKTPNKNPARTPAVKRTVFATATEDDKVCSVEPQVAADAGATLLKANDVAAEGSLAATRPRRSQRKAAAYA